MPQCRNETLGTQHKTKYATVLFDATCVKLPHLLQSTVGKNSICCKKDTRRVLQRLERNLGKIEFIPRRENEGIRSKKKSYSKGIHSGKWL
jgi:hypothetical protein